MTETTSVLRISAVPCSSCPWLLLEIKQGDHHVGATHLNSYFPLFGEIQAQL